MLERALLRKEIAVSAMTIDQHRPGAGASSVLNMLEGIGRVTGYINGLRVHLFSSFLVTQHSSELILNYRLSINLTLIQSILSSTFLPILVCYLFPYLRLICQIN